VFVRECRRFFLMASAQYSHTVVCLPALSTFYLPIVYPSTFPIFPFMLLALYEDMSIAVDAWSGAWTTFFCTDANVVGSNPTCSMDVCVDLLHVCAVVFIGAEFASD
jgi:hypothetical protein